MVPTQRIFQDNIIMTVHPSYACITIHLFVLLFIMRTADDLRNQLKSNIDEHYKLLVPEIRNGLVLYMNTDLANHMQETVRLVSMLVSEGDANFKALFQPITCLLTTALVCF